MYPFFKLSFKNLSSLICSSGVRLYDLNDFGWNPSFSSILWSQDQDEGNQSALSSSKMFKYLWYSWGICSSGESPSFCSLCCNFNGVEGLCTYPDLIFHFLNPCCQDVGVSRFALVRFGYFLNQDLPFPAMGLVVQFFLSSSSTSSVIEGLGVFLGPNASHASFFARVKGESVVLYI